MDKEDATRVVAGTGATGVGSYLVIKSLKKSGEPEKKEIVGEVVRIIKKKPSPTESTKKAGDYIYRRAVLKKNGRVLQRKIETRAAGLGGANWFAPRGLAGRAMRVFSVNEENNMILLREKKFSSDGNLVKKLIDTDYETSTKAEKEARKEKRKGKKLENSHRGLGRSLILGGMPGALAAYTTKSQAEDDYREGYSEDEIVKRAGKRGAKRGAIAGAVHGGIAAAVAPGPAGKKILVLPASAALGALGAHLGAKKNAKVRIKKTKAESKED